MLSSGELLLLAPNSFEGDAGVKIPITLPITMIVRAIVEQGRTMDVIASFSRGIRNKGSIEMPSIQGQKLTYD
jgi:hypothetical protein